MTKIESHYAPEKLDCPKCSTTGEMTFNDKTSSFTCCSCGTLFETSELPSKVQVNR